MGADGGIGGTYGVMPELYLRLNELVNNKKFDEAKNLQYEMNEIINILTSCNSNMYADMKEILRRRENIDIGGVRKPLHSYLNEDEDNINKCIDLINKTVEKYNR